MASIRIRIPDAIIADVIDAFAALYNYRETITDPETGEQIPNPLSKADFARRKVEDYVKEIVKAYRVNRAAEIARSTEEEKADKEVKVGEPELVRIEPSKGEQGETLTLTITGRNTSFDATSVVSFDPPIGITISNVNAVDDFNLQVEVSISISAIPGKRSLTVTTGAEVVTLADAFAVIVQQIVAGQ